MVYLRKYILLLHLTVIITACFAQQKIYSDSTHSELEYILPPQLPGQHEQVYFLRNGMVLNYPKPKPFSFITRLPGDTKGIFSAIFKKRSLKPVLVFTGVSVAAYFADQWINDETQRFSRKIHLDGREKNVNLVTIKMGKKPTTLIKVPGNINTAFYQIGQGAPALLIASGLFIYGKIHTDYRSLSTASQLAESFIIMGITSQLLKRTTGRESPGESSVARGKWRPFPSFKEFQNNTPRYDAFPSGHLATLMSSVVILAENYPEKRWIKPIGYSLTGLVGLAMINNGVHWASDYPLAIGLGYLCGRQLVKKSRKQLQGPTHKKTGELSYTVHYERGILMPGIHYRF